jgi:hypothetical protein
MTVKVFAEIEKLFSRLTQHIVNVSLTFPRKICLPVASRLAIKLVNYVKCLSDNDNNNKMHNYYNSNDNLQLLVEKLSSSSRFRLQEIN